MACGWWWRCRPTSSSPFKGAASGAPTRGLHAVGSGPGDGALSGVARIQPPIRRPTSATIELTWRYCPSDSQRQLWASR